MKKAPICPNEDQRLEALHSRGFNTMVNDARFDSLTKEAVEKLGVTISTVTIIDRNDEIYLSHTGQDQTCGARDISFCGHALVEEDVLIVEDTYQDERFKDNPYVVGEPYVRFYAGMRLLDYKTGQPIGVFCVKDTKPRRFKIDELGIFMELSSRAEQLIQAP